MKKLFLIGLLFLNGCVSLEQRIQNEGDKTGAPQEYIDAVKHGCASGRASAGSYDKFQKDYEQYKNNQEYAMRWDDAFRLCKGKYEDSMRAWR